MRHWSFVVGAGGWTYCCKSAAGGESACSAGARPERGSEHCDGAREGVQLRYRSHSGCCDAFEEGRGGVVMGSGAHQGAAKAKLSKREVPEKLDGPSARTLSLITSRLQLAYFRPTVLLFHFFANTTLISSTIPEGHRPHLIPDQQKHKDRPPDRIPRLEWPSTWRNSCSSYGIRKGRPSSHINADNIFQYGSYHHDPV